MPVCTICKNEKEIDQFDKIDDKVMCHSCLYQNHKPFKIFPIGLVENQLEQGEGFELKGSRNEVSKILLFESQRPFLYKLEMKNGLLLYFIFINNVR